MPKMNSVWAVAGNTIAQAVRMKIAVAVIVLLVVLLPMMSMIMVGDGTVHGKLQTFVSYGLSLTSLLLCVLTIAIATYTLTNDLNKKYIYLVLTKPIGRFQLLCGKLLGVVILDIFLLAVFAAIIYGLTLAIPRISGAGPEEIAKARREFFTARLSLTDEIDEAELNKLVAQAYEKLEKTNQLPQDVPMGKILSTLRGIEKLKTLAVEIGDRKIWEFENVKLPKPDEPLFIRYKYEVATEPADSKVYARWLIGDYRQIEYGTKGKETPIARADRADIIKTYHEFTIPGNVVTDDGYLAVVFMNPPINQTTVIPEDVEVLYRADYFGANYIRVVLVILARLIFLAVLGISASTWLSFPVAILICIVVFFIGTVNGFIIDSLDTLNTGAGLIYMITVKPILWFLPRFDGQFNPTQFMVTAKVLSWSFLAKVCVLLVFVKALLLYLLGVWIFSNREIAKITV